MADKPLTVSVRVQPNAPRSRIVKFRDGVLYVRLAAPPVEGKANEALIRHLSDVFDVAKSSVSIEKGLNSRNKTVAIAGIDPERFTKRIENAVAMGER
jgi:uncharacterized protein (TIGR00251 family)